MIRVAVVGLGKMGLSHHAIISAHPSVSVDAVCDSTGYLLDVLGKYTGIRTYKSFEAVLNEVPLDAVIVATPSSLHAGMVRAALERNLHVFCEKPFSLSAAESESMARLAEDRGVVNQVGYHHRFVGAFKEVKRLLDAGAIGKISHVIAEAYGPVVLRPKGATWRTRRSDGGGCLYDYAAHPINLLNWYFGTPSGIGGSALNKVFSAETDDEVVSTLYFPDGMTAQLLVNWSDESYRKMSTKITIWGTKGRINADRQECQVYFSDAATPVPGYRHGWNIRYATDLAEPVWFYVRGEEYSAQLNHFVECIEERRLAGNSSFADGAATDRVIEMIIADADRGPHVGASEAPTKKSAKRFRLFGSR